VAQRKQNHDFQDLFEGLTAKQHEVMRFVSDNFTSKEIAYELSVSESAVNQRIEAVRARAGSPPRAELARAYRAFLLHEQDLLEACNPLPHKNLQVPIAPVLAAIRGQDERVDELALSDVVAFQATPPWQGKAIGRIVPEVLDGTHAGLNRTAAIVAIAVGTLFLALGGLGVVRALSDMF